MGTMNQIAQGFGYIIITCMVLFGLLIWRIAKKAPHYENMEENRIMGLTDRITELEKEKENLKGDCLRAKAKQAEAEINLATANMLKATMQKEIGELRESIKADGKALVETADANEKLRLLNKSNNQRISELEMLFADLDEMTRKALMEKQDVKVSL